MKQILLILSFGVLTSFTNCKEHDSTKNNTSRDSTKTLEELHNENLADTVYYNSNSVNINYYIEKEYQYIKNNKIKTINRSHRQKEYYDENGVLIQIDYLSDNIVWGELNVVKKDDEYYYTLLENGKNIRSDDKIICFAFAPQFFIEKKWPMRETIVEQEIILRGSDIESISTFFEGKRSVDIYIRRGYDDDKIDKIITYQYEYHIDYSPYGSVPDREAPKVKKKYPSENNVIPILAYKSKYQYDENDRLIEVENIDIFKNTSYTNKLEYNERGIVSKNENGETFEYEYYK